MGGPRGEEGSALDPCHLNDNASAHVESPSCLETSLMNDVHNSQRAEPGPGKSQVWDGQDACRCPASKSSVSSTGPLPEQEPGVSGLARAQGQSWLVLRTSSHEDAEEGRFTSHVPVGSFCQPPPPPEKCLLLNK